MVYLNEPTYLIYSGETLDYYSINNNNNDDDDDDNLILVEVSRWWVVLVSFTSNQDDIYI